MKFWQMGAFAGLLGFAAVPAVADNYETLYSYKAWQVQGVTFDDGSIACLAEVSDPGESFTIWAFQDSSITLQFYSDTWDFGDEDYADLQIEIDRRSPWSVPGAKLTGSSVIYDLPDTDGSVDFVLEVARGSTLHLRTEAGEFVQDYSLAGSSASISNLIDCRDIIMSDSNPFK